MATLSYSTSGPNLALLVFKKFPTWNGFTRNMERQHQFALLGINQADPKDDIATFGTNFHVTYPLLFDKGGIINATLCSNSHSDYLFYR